MRFLFKVAILKREYTLYKIPNRWKERACLDLQSLRILMEINALQSFGTVQNLSTNAESSSTSFSSILGEVLSGVNSATKNTDSLTSLLYNGKNDVFLPASLNFLPSKSQEAPANHLIENNTVTKQHKNDYTQLIKKAAEQFQLPERLISSVIKHESNFNSQTVSHAGAQGLMQLMPGTAKFLGVQDSFDPEQNITGGARYLRQMLDQFDGQINIALAAYNAGPGNVRKYGGIPPFKETQNYVTKVLNSFQNEVNL